MAESGCSPPHSPEQECPPLHPRPQFSLCSQEGQGQNEVSRLEEGVQGGGCVPGGRSPTRSSLGMCVPFPSIPTRVFWTLPFPKLIFLTPTPQSFSPVA